MPFTPEFFLGLACGLPLGALLLFAIFLLAIGWADEQEEREHADVQQCREQTSDAMRESARSSPLAPRWARADDVDGFAQKREVAP